MKISEIKKAGLRGIEVSGEIIDISEPRNVTLKSGQRSRVADAILRDETDEVSLTLWDEQIDNVKVGDRVTIKNGYTTEFRGEIKLNVGRYGTLIKEDM
jgi:replication factor A1